MRAWCHWHWLAAAVLALAGCAGIEQSTAPSVARRRPGDLVAAAREWTVTDGRVAARDRLERELMKVDERGGWFERRMEATNADPSLTYPDSWARMPLAERRRTGVFFVLGYNQRRGRSPPIIRRAAEYLAQRGFHALVLDTPGRLPVEESADRVAAWLAEELPQVDRAMVVGFSRGATDLTEFFLTRTGRLPEHELSKIRVWMNFAGVLRGSAVARWGAYGRGMDAALFRAFLNGRDLRPFHSFADLASISGDPWQVPRHHLPATLHSLRVINLPVIPDGPDGWPTTDRFFALLGKRAALDDQRVGPCDGLVETAAAVLPPDTGLRQWVVRVRGSHAVLDGRYPHGGLVAEGWNQGRAGRRTSGIELMDDLWRALPRWILNGQ